MKITSKYLNYKDILWCLCVFGLIYGIIAITQNTPKQNGEWNSTKISLEKYVNGANSFFEGTQAFAGNSLHLDTWNGYQELTTKKQFSPYTIDFRFKLQKNAYMYSEFARNNGQFSSFRLSNNPQLLTAAVITDKNGKFLFKDTINLPLEPDRWYSASIRYDSPSKTASLFVNDTFVKSLKIDNIQGEIGFRGGSQSSLITDVIVKNERGNVIFLENFSFHNSLLILQLLLISIVFYTFWVICKSYFKTHMHFTYPILMITQIFLLCTLSIVFLMNYYYVDKYTRIDGLFSFYWNTKEGDWKSYEREIVNNKLLSLPNKKNYRVVFIGSSQTWGAGANTEKDTFVSQSETLVNNMLQLRKNDNGSEMINNSVDTNNQTQTNNADFINAGISGFDSTELLTQYKNSWKNMLQPDLIVLDLSNNDEGPTKFESNLREFVSINQPDTKTLFVLEAVSFENDIKIAENHAIMNKVGEELHIPVIDLQGYMNTQYDTGILWWDHVHMTTYGQQLTAELLTEKIIPLIDKQ